MLQERRRCLSLGFVFVSASYSTYVHVDVRAHLISHSLSLSLWSLLWTQALLCRCDLWPPYRDRPDRVRRSSEPGTSLYRYLLRHHCPVNNMEIRDSVDHGQVHEDPRQTNFVYGKSSIARGFGMVLDHLRGFETSVNTSTFGRVFRLDGSGHVGQISPGGLAVQTSSAELICFADERHPLIIQYSRTRYRMPAFTPRFALD